MHVSVQFYHSPIKTVGGVRKSTKKCTKMTSLSPAPVEPLIGRPRDLCPEVTFLKMHIHEHFRDDRTSGKWSKNPDRQTDGPTHAKGLCDFQWTKNRPTNRVMISSNLL